MEPMTHTLSISGRVRGGRLRRQFNKLIFLFLLLNCVYNYVYAAWRGRGVSVEVRGQLHEVSFSSVFTLVLGIESRLPRLISKCLAHALSISRTFIKRQSHR